MAVRMNLNLRRELRGRVPMMTEAMGRQAVKELKRKTTSYWPVRTGLSKRSFYYKWNPRSKQVFIRNRQEYAVYVNAQGRNTDAVGRTLRRPQNRRRIIAAGRAELERAERKRQSRRR